MNNKGFSLIEVLIAMAIFSIGILAVLTMQISAINANSNSDQSTIALEIASSVADILLSPSIDYNDNLLSENQNGHSGNEINGFAENADFLNAFDTRYTITRFNIKNNGDVEETPQNNSLSDLKRIDIVVQWTNEGLTRSIELAVVRSRTDHL